MYLLNQRSSLNGEASPGVPFMTKFQTNSKLFDSTDVIQLNYLVDDEMIEINVSWTEIVVLNALWQAFLLSTCEMDDFTGGESYLNGMFPPHRMFIKNEINPNRKSDENGTTPRSIVNLPVSSTLCATLAYPGSIGEFKPLGSSRMMIGYGVTADNIRKVIRKIEEISVTGKVRVSDDISGFERNFSEQLFAISAGIHSRTLRSNTSVKFLYNYSTVRTDNVYLLPGGILVRKKTPSLMPSGDLFTTLINCIARLTLARMIGNDAIVAGDDCIDITDDLNVMEDNYKKLGIQVRDLEVCTDEYYFCSATLRPNGDHIPTESSFVDSFVRAVAAGESLTQCVTANIPRCIGLEAYQRCFSCAEYVNRLAADCGLNTDWTPLNVVCYHSTDGPLIYEANLNSGCWRQDDEIKGQDPGESQTAASQGKGSASL